MKCELEWAMESSILCLSFMDRVDAWLTDVRCHFPYLSKNSPYASRAKSDMYVLIFNFVLFMFHFSSGYITVHDIYAEEAQQYSKVGISHVNLRFDLTDVVWNLEWMQKIRTCMIAVLIPDCTLRT